MQESSTSAESPVQPYVTVIVTCFNRASHVGATIESIKAADPDSRSEIIVVDDCSTDGSVPVIRDALRARDSLIVHEVNSGQNAAINTAMRSARGSIIAFCDSDDLYEPTFLEKTMASLEDQSLGFVYTQVVKGPDWNLSGCDRYAAALEQGFVANLGSLVVRAEAFNSIGPLGEREVPLDMCQDDRICFELARRYCFEVIREPLYHLQGSSNSVTKNDAAVVFGWGRLFDDYRGDIYLHCRPGTLARHRVTNLARAAMLPAKKHFALLWAGGAREALRAPWPPIEIVILLGGGGRVAARHVWSWIVFHVRKLFGARSTR